MGIVGDHPETGVRFVLERGARGASEDAWVYRGDAFTPDARHSLEVHVSQGGDVSVAGNAPPEIGEKVRLLFRTLYRDAAKSGGEPPRKVVRWRGEK